MEVNEITIDIARKVLQTIDAGLVKGAGVPEPGKMCVEAAVCYGMGLPHGDNPTCVSLGLPGRNGPEGLRFASRS